VNIWMYHRGFAVPGRVDPGGITKAVTGLAGALPGKSASVPVLCEAPESIVTDTEGGYRQRAFPQHARARLRLSGELRRFIADSEPPDLVLLNGIFTANVARLARVLRRRGIPYVHAPHDPYSPAVFARNRHIKIPYWWLIERPLIAGARAVQLLDARQEHWLRTRHLDVSAITVPNGVAAEDLVDEQPLPSQNDRPARALFLGQLDAFNKGIDLLIDAAAPLDEQIELTIQGHDTGDGEKLVTQARARNISVEFLPADYTTGSSRLVARHDLLCLPSRFDGFGLTALEAMVAGRVLLVSEEAGSDSHVRASGCGVVVAPTVESIRQGLTELLNRREAWASMGKAGREYVLANLVWDEIAQRALEDYRRLIATTAP
jgi:glycosyltransferase involved in cell wall biosynthesis